MPRAALLSLHARVDGVDAGVLDDPSLVQLWGPRHQLYVVAVEDLPAFTLGRLPTDARGRRRAVETAEAARAVLDGGVELPFAEVGRALDIPPNALRYAAPTGTLLVRWDGARQPTVRLAPKPDVDEREARHELARRHLRVQGPSTPEAFARWAGVGARHARTTFAELADVLVPVRTPIGDAWVLDEDVDALRAGGEPATGATRMLPSGDAYWLLHGEQRELLVPDANHRRLLWTPRVWPGALLLGGSLVGTWRRAGTTVDVQPWQSLATADRAAVEAAAEHLPLPDAGPVRVRWG